MSPSLHMPKCLADLPKHPKAKSLSQAERMARRMTNESLEAAARDIEALARNFPSWKPALSSAAQRIRERMTP